jgi:transposase
MKDISSFNKILIGVRPIDFRKQANGLSNIVKETLESHPLDSKSLFVFINRKRTSIRMLYWDLTGYAVWSKKLEKDKFKWPKKAGGSKLALSTRELKWLLQGIDLERLKMHEPLTFEKTL